jgi:hypothetical protein
MIIKSGVVLARHERATLHQIFCFGQKQFFWAEKEQNSSYFTCTQSKL